MGKIRNFYPIKGTAKRTFDELRDKGFIKIGIDSNFNYKEKKSRRWIITQEMYLSNRATNEWKKWGPEN